MFNWLNKTPDFQKSKTLGQLGEIAAQEEYIRQGFKIIAKNQFNKKGLRLGEIDFIAEKDRNIVFVEVKTRRAGVQKFGSGAEAVNIFKQRKILKAIKVFLLQNMHYQAFIPRVDICLMELSELDKSIKCAKIITNAVEDWN